MTRAIWICLLSVFFIAESCAKNDSTKVNDKEEVKEDSTANNNKDQEDPKGMKITLADPTIFYDSKTDKYYLYGTSGSDVVHKGFKVFSSTDLKDWKMHEKLALSKKDVYGADNFWAPQVFENKEKYYMAYTANEHIAIAVSDSPLGPFKQESKTPISDPEGVGTIDPYIFKDDDGKMYLYYVRFKNGNWLYVAELNEELTDINTTTVKFCISALTNTQSWELDQQYVAVTEGPTVIKHSGKYFFFYSANHFENPNYAVGYATADSPTGPWTKYEGNPILDKEMIDKNGSGHGDFFQDKKGQFYYVFHTHFSKKKVQPRLTAIIKGKFTSDKNNNTIFKMDTDSFRYLEVK